MAGTLRVLLAEDHATVRQGLKLLIDTQPDMHVIGEAGDGDGAIALARQLNPDVLVLDLAMPGTSGLVAARRLRDFMPALPIVTLTRYAEDAYLQELLRAGVSAYVLKQSASTELLQAIRAAAAGGHYLDSSVTSRVAARFAGPGRQSGAPARGVTAREAEVLRFIARGYSNKEIAAQLDLSVKTVEVHKANAMRKLGLGGRIDIVNYAIVQGWLHDD